MIHIYNSKVEDHTSDKNNFYIGRPSILSNPYTHNGVRSNIAALSFKTREEALNAYEEYFKVSYQTNEEFKKEFDKIYELYKNGEEVYLQCFCKPEKCHGDIIARELQRKLIKDKRKELKNKSKL